MTFGLPSWLKSRYGDLGYEVPVWYPAHDQPDHREWLVTNGRGGYAASTISGAHTRRYHGYLVAALDPPHDRHVVLSRLDELVVVGDVAYELSTNHWTSGVVAPTGYKLIESFTTLPSPTWVYNLNGHYLIKQLTMPWGFDQAQIGYFWLPDEDGGPVSARLSVRLLTGFRHFHDELSGSSQMCYSQQMKISGSEIRLGPDGPILNLAWSGGTYEPQESWWWSYHWPEEAARVLPDREDLVLTGNLTVDLDRSQQVFISAAFNQPADRFDLPSAIEHNLKRQNSILARSAIPRAPEINLLVLACDQFLVDTACGQSTGVIAGYPWFPESGRDAMISLPGLALATRRFDDARRLLAAYGGRLDQGLLYNRMPDRAGDSPGPSADATLWWAWALYMYYRASDDLDFVREQYPVLKEAARQYVEGTRYGIKLDTRDGLVRVGSDTVELTWMDAQVEGIPITPRSGKPVEICALWYSLLETLRYFAALIGEDTGPFDSLSTLCQASMQKFWNNDAQCLYDVLEPGNKTSDKPIQSMRPNQIIAVALPFRAFTKLQEKAILTAMDRELLTPVGLRSLSPTDPSYQGRYGCGFSRADQYHRDLSLHQGTVWPWLLGPYCDALLNVHGPLPETYQKMRILVQPLMNHLIEEGCVGSISEIFDGSSPHTPRGCFAQAWSVAEVMRVIATTARNT